MGDIDTAVRGARQLEGLLEQRFGAQGRGLHEKLSSVEAQIPLPVVKQIRWIASLRNRVVHEGAVIDDVTDFKRAVTTARRRLEALPATGSPHPHDGDEVEEFPRARRVRPRRKLKSWPVVVVLVVLVAVGVLRLSKAGREARARVIVPATSAEISEEAAVNEPEPPATIAADSSLAGKARRASLDAAQARKDIDQLWRTIKEDTRVDLGESDVKDNGDGTSDILVPVTWSLDPEPLLATLNKYFWDYKQKPIAEAQVDFTDHMGSKAPGIAVSRMWNDAKDQKRPFSEELLVYLTRQRARIRVNAGKYSGTLTFAAGRECSVSCGGLGKDMFQVHLRNLADPKLLLEGRDQNPVRIAKVPNAALAKMVRPVASVEISPAQSR